MSLSKAKIENTGKHRAEGPRTLPKEAKQKAAKAKASAKALSEKQPAKAKVAGHGPTTLPGTRICAICGVLLDEKGNHSRPGATEDERYQLLSKHLREAWYRAHPEQRPKTGRGHSIPQAAENGFRNGSTRA
jgi:hypothetical protein